MTIPYQAISGSAIQRLIQQMQGRAQPTPPFNPNAPDPQMQEAFTQGLGQNPAMGEGTGLLAQPDDAHEHQKGIRGGLLHLIGADRMPPELAANLTPDQERRVKPGLARSLAGVVFERKGPQGVMQDRADNLLGLEAARNARTAWADIQRQTAQIPNPLERLKTAAALAAAMGLEQGNDASLASQRLDPREFAPQRVTVTPRAVRLGGRETMLNFTNTGEWQHPDGRQLSPEEMATLEPMPPQVADTFSPMSGGETPSGNVPLLGTRSGTVRDSGIAARGPSDRTTAAVRAEVSQNRAQIQVINEALAELRKYPNAIGLGRYAGDAVNQRVDPRGVPARAALANIGSLKIHDRSGAAVSAREFPRLTPFIPSVTDTYEAAVTKLQALLRELNAETAELEKGAPATAPINGTTVTLNGKTFIIPLPR